MSNLSKEQLHGSSTCTRSFVKGCTIPDQQLTTNVFYLYCDYCVTESSPILNKQEKISVKKIPRQFHFFVIEIMHIFSCSVVHMLRQCIFECLLFTDNRVRGRVCTYLKGRFRSLEAAEETYNLTLSDALAELTVGHPKQRRNNNAVQLRQQSATNPQQNPPVVACQCSLLFIKLS